MSSMANNSLSADYGDPSTFSCKLLNPVLVAIMIAVSIPAQHFFFYVLDYVVLAPSSPMGYGYLLLGVFCFLLLLAVGIVSLVYIYQMWHWLNKMQPEASHHSAAKIIGFMFIPFFNLYWIFIVLQGFVNRLNAFVDKRQAKIKVYGQLGVMVIAAYFVLCTASSLLGPALYRLYVAEADGYSMTFFAASVRYTLEAITMVCIAVTSTYIVSVGLAIKQFDGGKA